MHKTLLAAAAIVLISASAAPVAGAAATAPVQGADCFRVRDVNNYHVIDAHTLRVHISREREYDLTTAMGFLNDLNFNNHVRLSAGLSRICAGPGGDTEIRNGSESWSVTTISRVPPAPPQPKTN